MKFDLKISFGSDKKQLEKKQIETPIFQEPFNGGFFYDMDNNLSIEQNNRALISMYNDLPEIQAPVNYLLDSLTIIPFKHYYMRGGVEVERENSNVIEVLKHPNQYQTENDFIKMFFINRIVLGIGYINRVKPSQNRQARQLYILPSQYTTPNLENSKNTDIRLNNIVSYTTTLGGQQLTIDKDDVFSQKETSLIKNNYIYARSRLMSAIQTSDSLRYNYEARIKLLKDRGATGLIFPATQGDIITPDQADEMRKRFYEQNGMTGNKFPFLIGARPLGFEATTMGANELQLNPNKLQDFQTVCAVLGMDSALFENSRGTYNNKILAKSNFWENVAIPYFNNYLQLLEMVFDLPKGDFLKADYSDIPALQDDFEKKVNANSKLWNDDIITEAEYRQQTGFEGGEEKTKSELSRQIEN